LTTTKEELGRLRLERSLLERLLLERLLKTPKSRRRSE
jgi:hypothetical protein